MRGAGSESAAESAAAEVEVAGGGAGFAIEAAASRDASPACGGPGSAAVAGAGMAREAPGTKTPRAQAIPISAAAIPAAHPVTRIPLPPGEVGLALVHVRAQAFLGVLALEKLLLQLALQGQR